MKRTPCYADLDEFWVIGDFVAKAFMAWGGDCHGYVDGADPCEAEVFLSYREARRFMKLDEDAAKWVEQHGGSRFVKPLRCRQSVVVYPPGRRP